MLLLPLDLLSSIILSLTTSFLILLIIYIYALFILLVSLKAMKVEEILNLLPISLHNNIQQYRCKSLHVKSSISVAALGLLEILGLGLERQVAV